MQQSKTILFFGNERLATGVTTDTPILKALVSNGYKVGAVVVTHSGGVPSRKPRELEVIEFARAHRIPLIELSRLAQSRQRLSEFDAEVGVLAAFGKLVPQAIIDLFPKGIINVHPSLLPRHRGSIPIEASILGGDNQTGVSLMQLSGQMDAGPLLDQVRIRLSGKESKQALADTLAALGAARLIAVLPDILSGKAVSRPQASAPVTYDKRLESVSGRLDFNKSGDQLEREIRAYLGWPRSRTSINGAEVVVTAAHTEPSSAKVPGGFRVINAQLSVSTADKELVIDRLIPAGGREMTGKQYLAGHSL